MADVLPLKILGRADLHDHIERLDGLKDIDADLIVFCGDLHNGSHKKEAMPVAAALARLGPPVLIVPGNMDHKDVVPDLWSEAGFIMLHRSFFRHGDYGFLGLGGMAARDPRRLGDPARYYHRDEEIYRIMAAAYPKISGTKYKIIVVHQPPLGAQDRLYNGESSGSVCLRRFIEEYQPDLLLCGHIHEDRGECSVGSTKIINVGELRQGFAALIDLGEVTKVHWIYL
jgi:Icc-related predicted phosphoesterase